VGEAKPGMCFTIEPMIALGTYRDKTWPDDWTSVTQDGKRTAQFGMLSLAVSLASHKLTLTRTHSLSNGNWSGDFDSSVPRFAWWTGLAASGKWRDEWDGVKVSRCRSVKHQIMRSNARINDSSSILSAVWPRSTIRGRVLFISAEAGQPKSSWLILIHPEKWRIGVTARYHPSPHITESRTFWRLLT